MSAVASVARHDVADLTLSAQGQRLIAWAMREMPVLEALRVRFAKEQPLKGVRIGACLHVTSETANLMITLKAGGADVVLCASNPLSTNDAIAAALVEHHGIPVFAVKGEDSERYFSHIRSVLETQPHITMDDGADLVTELHTGSYSWRDEVIGGTEETTTGVIRMQAMHKDGTLQYPVIAVNEAMTKHMFDNRYGTGQSTLDGIIRSTNVLLAGRTFVVCGYGWCGRGLASRAHGLGAHVVVTEVDPVRAIEAVMDGHRVARLEDIAPYADLVVTVTGDINVVDQKHLDLLKDGCIIANSGHFNDEINVDYLRKTASEVTVPRQNVETFSFPNGRTLHLLAEGRLVNLSAAEGHPAAVMDMSFANQALCVEHLVTQKGSIAVGVHDVPEDIDRSVAALKLAAMGISIDELTKEQKEYLSSWQTGTR